MAEQTNDVTVTNNVDASRFEATVDGHVAFAEYGRVDNDIVFTHTIVPPELEGRGLASKIVHTALDHARAEHLAVVPLCPFVASYLRRHPEYHDIVNPAYRSRVA